MNNHFKISTEIRASIHAKDLELINSSAEMLNVEALDVLEYQVPIEEIEPKLS